jgi:hypothetical protein
LTDLKSNTAKYYFGEKSSVLHIPGWLEESDQAGRDFVRDGRSMPAALTDQKNTSVFWGGGGSSSKGPPVTHT